MEYQRALLHELNFEYLKALPHYKNAYSYQPDNLDYSVAYADALEKQNKFCKAIYIYEGLLCLYHPLVKRNRTVYLPVLAKILNNLVTLYRKAQNYPHTETHYQEALEYYSSLAKQLDISVCKDTAVCLIREK